MGYDILFNIFNIFVGPIKKLYLKLFKEKPNFFIRPDKKIIDIKATAHTITAYAKSLSSQPHNIIDVHAEIEELPDRKIEVFKPELKLPIKLQPNDAEQLIRFGVHIGRLDQDKKYTLCC